jgi:hypothetical protein
MADVVDQVRIDERLVLFNEEMFPVVTDVGPSSLHPSLPLFSQLS